MLLPRREVSSYSENDETAVLDAPKSHRTILIAEDDYELAHALTKRCREMDWDVFRSPDAMHALLGAHRIRPDLLLLDVQLSSGNGLSVAEFLKADKSGLANIPIVVMSGRSDDEMVRRCQAIGARLVQKTPQLWNDLQPLIRDLLDGKSLPEIDGAPDLRRTPHIKLVLAQPTEAAVPAPRDQEPTKAAGPVVLCIDD
ncbi:MAG TPA: response regulator, partial [Pirellulales bacterium]|nr:response regulator [Pirellulales bacterium]